jgi:hypothetical protein
LDNETGALWIAFTDENKLSSLTKFFLQVEIVFKRLISTLLDVWLLFKVFRKLTALSAKYDIISGHAPVEVFHKFILRVELLSIGSFENTNDGFN